MSDTRFVYLGLKVTLISCKDTINADFFLHYKNHLNAAVLKGCKNNVV